MGHNSHSSTPAATKGPVEDSVAAAREEITEDDDHEEEEEDDDELCAARATATTTGQIRQWTRKRRGRTSGMSLKAQLKRINVPRAAAAAPGQAEAWSGSAGPKGPKKKSHAKDLALAAVTAPGRKFLNGRTNRVQRRRLRVRGKKKVSGKRVWNRSHLY